MKRSVSGSLIAAGVISLCSSAMAAGKTFVVNNGVVSASDENPGTEARPLRTIQAGANLAQPGDTVLVHSGIYREEVVPPCGGTSTDNPIMYKAAGKGVSIRGSEQINTWQDQGGGVWMVELDTAFFKGYNPFARRVWGAWLGKRNDYRLGDVYCNGEALRQQLALEDMKAKPHTWYVDLKYGYVNRDDVPEDRQYPKNKMKIWANFGDVNPNTAMTEINVRKACIFPEKAHLKYIVIDGFDIRHAAPQWGDIYWTEYGAVGMKYGYGWTIQNCTIAYSRNIGISMGVTDEVHFPRPNEGDLGEGGSNIPPMDKIGHHLIRNNVIRRCGQCGIYGCYGAVGSRIEGNVITETNYRSEWFGQNQAAIKILFPIDVVIRDNLLVGTPRGPGVRGIWLDWGSQNTRVTGNIVTDFDGSGGLFLEVNFGPIIVDNNIFARTSILVESNGAIFANNLFSKCKFYFWCNPERKTPYYKPHSTVRTGKTLVTLDHIRILNNIVSGDAGFANPNMMRKGNDTTGFETNGNVFLDGAGPFPKKDEKSVVSDAPTDLTIEERDGRWVVHCDLPEAVFKGTHTLVTSKLIGHIPLAEMPMENPDGTPLDITSDFFGKPITPGKVLPGPIQAITPGRNVIEVWPKQAGSRSGAWRHDAPGRPRAVASTAP